MQINSRTANWWGFVLHTYTYQIQYILIHIKLTERVEDTWTGAHFIFPFPDKKSSSNPVI